MPHRYYQRSIRTTPQVYKNYTKNNGKYNQSHLVTDNSPKWAAGHA